MTLNVPTYNYHVFMIIVWQSSEIWKITVVDTFAVFSTQLSQYGVKILWKGSTTIVTDRQTDGRTDGTAEVLSY